MSISVKAFTFSETGTVLAPKPGPEAGRGNRSVIKTIAGAIFSPVRTPVRYAGKNEFYETFESHRDRLFVDGESIGSKYKDRFDAIDKTQSSFDRLKRENPEEAGIELVEDFLEEERSTFRKEVADDFHKYLQQQLGPARLHLEPEITDRFSVKAFTGLECRIQTAVAEELGALVTGDAPVHSCSLFIPPEGPVVMKVKTEGSYKNVFRPEPELLDPPCEYKGFSHCVIDPNGKTQSEISFRLR